MTKSKVFAALLVCAGICTRAHAQPAEVGVGIGGVHVADGGDLWGRGFHSADADARGSITLTDRFALESFVTYGRRSIPIPEYVHDVTGGDTVRVEGLYGVVVRQRLRSTTRPGFHVFISYGIGGGYARDTTPPRQYFNGRSVVALPGFSYTQNNGLLFPLAGVGVYKSLGEHLALRVESQAVTFVGMPIGVRLSAGVAVPIGGTTR